MQKKTVPVSKTCPVCTHDFLVCPPGKSSRHYPRNEQVFCSTLCSGKARYRHGGICEQLSPEDAIYLAGFFDGEGSIILYRRGDKVRLRLTLSNCNLQVLEWIATVTGYGSIISKPVYSHRHQPAYLYQLNADAAASLLEQLLPYLRVRQPQAELAIEFQHNMRDPTMSSATDWQQEHRQRMHVMNNYAARLAA